MVFQQWFRNRRRDEKAGRSIPEHPTNRTDLTYEQLGILEDFYSQNRYPNNEDVQDLMRLTNLTYKKLKVRVIKINNFNFTD